MKKLIAGSLIASMLIVPAMAQDVSVYLNNERMIFDQNPIIENGRTLVPLRSIFEGLGAEVKWNPDKQEIRGTTSNKEVVLRVGDTSATVNGEEVTLDVPAKIENGRTLVPLRFISESLDADVKWNEDAWRVDIDYKEKFLFTVYKDGKYGLLDEKNNLVIPYMYDKAEYFNEEMIRVSNDGKYGFLNNKGKEIIPIIYDDAKFRFKEGFVWLNKGVKYGCVDKEGKEITQFIYDNVHSFNEGMAAVSIAGKWGFIDKDGKEMVSIIYDEVFDFSDELAVARKDGKYGCINKQGSIVIPFIYDGTADRFNKYEIIAVEKNGKFGCIDKNGNTTIPFIYDGIGTEFNDQDLLVVKKNGKYGYINAIGEEVIPCLYDSEGENIDGMICMKKDGEKVVFDKWGNIKVDVTIYNLKAAETVAQRLANTLEAGVAVTDIPLTIENVNQFGISMNNKVLLIDATSDNPQSVLNIAGVEGLYNLSIYNEDLVDPMGDSDDVEKNYFRVYWEGYEENEILKGQVFVVNSESAMEKNNGEMVVYAKTTNQITQARLMHVIKGY